MHSHTVGSSRSRRDCRVPTASLMKSRAKKLKTKRILYSLRTALVKNQLSRLIRGSGLPTGGRAKKTKRARFRVGSLAPRVKTSMYVTELFLVHVRVNLRSGNISVTKQFLDHSQICPVSEQVSCE